MTVRIVHRPARTSPTAAPPEDREIQRPPSLPEGENGFGSLLMLVPMLGAGASMTLMMLFRGSSLAAIGALMMLVTVLASVVLVFSQRGRAARMRRTRRERYLDYLERQRLELRDRELHLDASAREADPEAAALLSIVRSPTRLWERRRDDEDFLRVRLGRGERPSTTFVRAGEQDPLTPPDEFMDAELATVEDRFSTGRDMPIRIPLAGAGSVSVVGDREFCEHVARVLLAQACTFSSPEDVHLAVMAPEDVAPSWRWASWLPHLADQDTPGPSGPRRRFARSEDELSVLLRPAVNRRLGAAAQRRRHDPFSSGVQGFPALLILSDTHGRPALRLPLDDPDLPAARLGITVIHLLATQADEPDDVAVRITRHDDGEVSVQLYGRRDQEPAELWLTPDPLAAAEAEAVARELAGLRLSPDSLEHDTARQAIEATRLLGVEDVHDLDLQTAWRPRPRSSFLRVPIGTDDDGEPVMLDLKESAQYGMGPHGLCVGATGSGKSELLRTLVLGILATHGPEDVSMILVDYKGGATFAPFVGAPQIHGVITNLSDDANLVERVYTSLAGEVQRRQQVLKDAGNLPDITSYRRHRAEALRTGSTMEALPHLLVIIDEFGELLTARPDFIELFLSIGRIGRSIGVHLLLSSQRIEGGKLRGLDTYLSYRIGLRTLSEAESRTVLDTPDAFSLPPLPGYAYLKVDTTTYTRFRAGYVSGPLPEPVVVERTEEQDPQVRELHLYPEWDAAPDDEPTGAGGVDEDEHDLERETVLSAVVGHMRGVPGAGSPVWLPPLPDRLTLDQAAGSPAATPHGWRLRRTRPLLIPIGTVDDPARQRQGVWELDLRQAGGHVLLIGAPRTGRTTFLMTLAAGSALTHSPRDLVIYALDLLGSALLPLTQLPHVGGVAVRMEREVVRRTVEEIDAILTEREALFRRHRCESIDRARELADAGVEELAHAMLADVVLLIDGFGQIADEFDEISSLVSNLARRGGGYGIHLVVTVSRWNEVRLNLQTFFGTRIELRLGDPGESGVGRKLSETLTADRPGRVLLPDGLFAQIALPRVDGDDEPWTSTRGWNDLAAKASTGTRHRAPQVRLLPDIVGVTDVDPAPRPGRVPIGLDETDLTTTYLDLDGPDRNLVVLGDSGTGRTNLLRHIALTLVEQYTPEELVFAVVDPRRTLHGAIPEDYVGGYAGSPALAGALVEAILPELRSRVPSSPDAPPSETGHLPRIVVLVDDYDIVTAGGTGPMAALQPFVAMSRELNLDVILARRTAGASRGVFEPLFMAVRDSGATGLMLSGDRSEGQLLGTVRPRRLPVGRTLVIRAGADPRTVQTVLRSGAGESELEGLGFGPNRDHTAAGS